MHRTQGVCFLVSGCPGQVVGAFQLPRVPPACRRCLLQSPSVGGGRPSRQYTMLCRSKSFVLDKLRLGGSGGGDESGNGGRSVMDRLCRSGSFHVKAPPPVRANNKLSSQSFSGGERAKVFQRRKTLIQQPSLQATVYAAPAGRPSTVLLVYPVSTDLDPTTTW